MTNDKHTVTVWDPLIRIGHWTLVAAFFIAYFTEDDLLTQHVWAGYTVGVVVLVRILWGIVGSKNARFSNFVYSPARVLEYLKNLLARKPQHYIGHNPAGGAMVIALLVSLVGTTVTGLQLYAVEENKGPLALTAAAPGAATLSINLINDARAKENEEEDDEVIAAAENSNHEVDKEAEEIWEEAHELFANLTLLLVLLHVAGVIASSMIDKEKLVKTMLTGKKDIDDSYR